MCDSLEPENEETHVALLIVELDAKDDLHFIESFYLLSILFEALYLTESVAEG